MISECGKCGRFAAAVQFEGKESRLLQQTYQIETRLESFSARLPFCRTYFISVLSYKLQRLDFSEKFICVSAYIAAVNLISHNLSVRINHKGSSFSHSVG